MPEFKQINRGGHLPDLIAAEIMERVTSGELAPGDRLPPESVLAESFGVSRNVVREAISRLRSDGVIDTKPRLGATILPLSQRKSFRIDADFVTDRAGLSELFELRGVLEIEAAGLAAQRCTKADVAAMKSAVDAATGLTVADEAWIEADAAFHRALGSATRNGYLSAFVDFLAIRIIETTRATRDVYGNDDLLEKTVEEHRTVLDAVASKDAAKARDAMYRHIKGAAERLGVEFSGQP